MSAQTPTEQGDFLSLPFEKLERAMASMGQPAFRAKQLFGWLHQKRADTYGTMGNLPASLRRQLARHSPVRRPLIARRQQSKDGTRKYLLRLADGNCVEAVLMQYRRGCSLCVSTQVGCRMGCRFCASTQGGLLRNLTAGEMAGEVYAVLADLEQEEPPAGAQAKNPAGSGNTAASGQSAPARISHLVLMGMGEPLDNYENVMDFLRIVTHPLGQNLSWRNISLSTCGVVPGIRRLAEEGVPLTLSVSLHAADNAARGALMPVNASWPVETLLAACRGYQQTTGRRVSYEYALVAGVNDREQDALKLAALLKGSGGHINLIPVNAVEGLPFAAADAARVKAFRQTLENAGLNATVRRRLGADIDAACGQLRLREMNREAGAAPVGGAETASVEK